MTQADFVKKISAQIIARVKEDKKEGKDPLTDEQVRKMVEDMLKEQNKLPPEDGDRSNGGFEIDDKDLQPGDDPLAGKTVKIDDGVFMNVKMLMTHEDLQKYYSPTLADKIVEFQKLNDEMLIVGTMLLGAKNKTQVVTTLDKVLKQTEIYKRVSHRLKSDEELRKALYTTGAGVGLEWIPTGFSNQLVEKIRLERKVASIFSSINMPTNPYKVPLESAGAIGYLIPESTADESTKIKASTPATANFSFSAKKLAGRVVYSDEIDEDSIINVMDFTRNSLAIAIAEAVESAVLNGDVSATHQDSDVISAYDARKAWSGLRYLARNNAGTATKDASNANLATTLLRGTRMLMGKHGVDPTKLFYVASPIGYIEFLNLSELLTIDKYGPSATIIRGESGKFDGGTLLVSEFAWDNLNASGVYDGSVVDRTAVHMVFAPAFWFGIRSGVTLASERDIETDQLKLVAKSRLDFVDVYDATLAANVQSALLYNVKTTL